MDQFKLFIGNLSYDTTIESLVEMFSKFGKVVDSYKPQGKGFAFIGFETKESMEAALAEMNGKEVDGREIVVNVARPREERPRGGFNRQ